MRLSVYCGCGRTRNPTMLGVLVTMNEMIVFHPPYLKEIAIMMIFKSNTSERS